MNKTTLRKANALYDKLDRINRIANIHAMPKDPRTFLEPSKRGQQKKHIGSISFSIPVVVKSATGKPEEADVLIRIGGVINEYQIEADAHFMDRSRVTLDPVEDEKFIESLITLSRVFRNAVMDELDRWKRSVQKQFDELEIIHEEEE